MAKIICGALIVTVTIPPKPELPSFTRFPEHEALGHGIAYISMAEVLGDVAEFGVFCGGSARVLAGAMTDDNNKARQLRLFDSFQGLPPAEHEIDKSAPHEASGAWTWHYPHNAGPTAEKVKEVCAEFLPAERITVYDGWFKDTLPTIKKDTKFALLHIDCDLYQSTYEVLDHLIGNDMLSDGCMVFFDDWYCNRGNTKFGQQAAFRAIQIKFDYYWITDVGPYATLGRRFIFHAND